MDFIKIPLALLFTLGLAMTLHEFGHYIVARWLKIRVEIFSFIGIGPRVWGFRRGHTDYRLSLIPLGAYVKLGGDESNASIEGGAGATDIPDEENFSLRPKWQKIAVALGGPLANILTALAIPFAGALIFGLSTPPPNSPAILQVARGGAAEAAGLQPGDRIVNFEGKENPSWKEIEQTAALVPAVPQPLAFVVERNGQRVNLKVTPQVVKIGSDEVGELGISPDYGPNNAVLISVVSPDGAAARGGLKPEDKILAINGEAVRSSTQATQMIRAVKDPTAKITVERGGQKLDLTTPVDQAKDERSGQTIGRLGVSLGNAGPVQKVGLVGAARAAIDINLDILRLTGRALGQLFSGERSARNTVSGPIGIARAAAQAAEGGPGTVINMLGFLSLNLGVFNLLPIPVLDGGMIFMLLLEGFLGLFGISLTLKLRERAQMVGMAALLLLMGFVITNDVLKIFSH
jgi:regulator of sigma E protease